MKTITITYHHTTNYGASLQAYALQKMLISLGCENEIFEYPYTKTKLKISIKNPRSILIAIYLKFFLCLRRKQSNKLQFLFKEFHEKYLKVTRIYKSLEDAKSNLLEYDCAVTGSDQVWKLSTMPEFVPIRFLDFGNDSMVRFSYAASIESLNYSDKQKEYVRNILKTFKGISVREESAKNYLESFINETCKVVLDPVFLLKKEDWDLIAQKPRIEGPYILCYQVIGNKRMQEVANLLKKRTNYPIVSVCNGVTKWIVSDYTFYDVSPEEFLGFYKNASIVISASFHGTAFGIIYQKPIYSLVKQNSSNRIKDLLSMLKLDKYIIDEDALIEYSIPNYKEVSQILDVKINESMNFLRSMLYDSCK